MQNATAVLAQMAVPKGQALLPDVIDIDWRELQLQLLVALPMLLFAVLSIAFAAVKLVWAVYRCCDRRRQRHREAEFKCGCQW